MSRGKYLSLEEARKAGKLEQFAKEHPSEANSARFKSLLEAMSKGVLEEPETSSPGSGAGSSGTRTRQGTKASGAKKRGRASR
jgi:hypothetical protein